MEMAYNGQIVKLLENAIDEVIGQPLKVVFTESNEWEKIKEDYKRLVQKRKAQKQA